MHLRRSPVHPGYSPTCCRCAPCSVARTRRPPSAAALTRPRRTAAAAPPTCATGGPTHTGSRWSSCCSPRPPARRWWARATPSSRCAPPSRSSPPRAPARPHTPLHAPQPPLTTPRNLLHPLTTPLTSHPTPAGVQHLHAARRCPRRLHARLALPSARRGPRLRANTARAAGLRLAGAPCTPTVPPHRPSHLGGEGRSARARPASPALARLPPPTFHAHVLWTWRAGYHPLSPLRAQLYSTDWGSSAWRMFNASGPRVSDREVFGCAKPTCMPTPLQPELWPDLVGKSCPPRGDTLGDPPMIYGQPLLRSRHAG